MIMSVKTDEQVVSSKLDVLKWLAVVVLVALAVVGNSYFSEAPLLYRVSGVLVLMLVALFVAANTRLGASFIGLLKLSRLEAKKIVWPTRQETLQTTGIVALVVAVMSVVMWLLDSILGYLISLLIG